MLRIVLFILAMIGSSLSLAAHPAQEAGANSPQATPAPVVSTVPDAPEDATHALLRQSIDQQSRQAAETARASQALHDQVESLRPNRTDKLVTAGIAITGGLIGALIGAFSGYALQRSRMRSERVAARQAAGLKELSEIKQFRGKQLNEFYGPLEALLKQGLIVRNELYALLEATSNPAVAFSRLPDPNATNGWSLGIAPAGQPVRPFRLLEDLVLLNQTFPSVMGTVNETVRINGLVVALIHKKVGLVLHGSDELSEQLGVFLAHQSVLAELHASVLAGNLTVIPQYTTTFPRKLPKLVTADCVRLRDELKEWQATVSSWMGDMALTLTPPP